MLGDPQGRIRYATPDEPWLYSRKLITDILPGECHNTFNRAALPPTSDDTPTPPANSSVIQALDTAAGAIRRRSTPSLGPLTDTFTCILIHASAHPHAPHELWTCANITLLGANAARPIPAFAERGPAAGYFAFAGCWRIVRWTVHAPRSAAVRAYVAKRRSVRPGRAGAAWEEMERREWACVRLEEVVDPILAGGSQRRYVLRYALGILGRAGALGRAMAPSGGEIQT